MISAPELFFSTVRWSKKHRSCFLRDDAICRSGSDNLEKDSDGASDM